MKKEIYIILFFTILSFLFIAAFDLWKTTFLSSLITKEYLLCALLVLIQIQLIHALANTCIENNPQLLKVKRKLFLFYIENTEQFPLLYTSVSKRKTHDAAGFLLAHLGISNMNENTYTMGKKWLENPKEIPYDTFAKKFSIRQKCRLYYKIKNFQSTCSQYEDLFFNCLSGKLIDKESTQSVVEIILIWLSYFYFLTEVFSIDLKEYTAFLITFLAVTIVDLSRHIFYYKINVAHTIDAINDFYDEMHQMRDLMQDKNCVYTAVEGEPVPSGTRSDSEEETAESSKSYI